MNTITEFVVNKDGFNGTQASIDIWQNHYKTYENRTLEALLKCKYVNQNQDSSVNYTIEECFLPEITNCDEAWFEDNMFSIAKIVDNIDSIEDETGQKYCCHQYQENGNLLESKVCNWYNRDIYDANDAYSQSFGKTGFLCKWLGEWEESDYADNFTVTITPNELRSGLKSLDGLLDPDTSLPWYDTGRQWPKQAECSYGAAMDQMTMTYVSFTGYLR